MYTMLQSLENHMLQWKKKDKHGKRYAINYLLTYFNNYEFIVNLTLRTMADSRRQIYPSSTWMFQRSRVGTSSFIRAVDHPQKENFTRRVCFRYW